MVASRLPAWIFLSFLSHHGISQRAVRTSLEKQLNPRGPIASRGGVHSRCVFPRKSIATCEFPGGGGGERSGPPVPPLYCIKTIDKIC